MKRARISIPLLLLTLSLLMTTVMADDMPEVPAESAETGFRTTISAEIADSDTETLSVSGASSRAALTVVREVECKRLLTIDFSKTTKAYLYSTATAANHAGAWFTANGLGSNKPQLTSSAYVDLSDGSRRYLICNVYDSAQEAYFDYYLIMTSAISEVSVLHTYPEAGAHPHLVTCECGASKYDTVSTCLKCYPATIIYDDNGGSGGPGSQTVKESPFTVSSIVPARFPYQFKSWKYQPPFFSAQYYYPGTNGSISAGADRTFTAVWKSPETITKTDTYESVIERIVDVTVRNSIGYIKITPCSTYDFLLESIVNDGDTKAWLYDANGNQLAADDDSGEGHNFQIKYKMTKDETYYLGVCWYGNDTTGEIPVTVRREVSLAYDENGGKNGPEDTNYYAGEIVTISNTKPVRPGYTFLGWADDPYAAEPDYLAGTGYVLDPYGDRIYAVWGIPSGKAGESITWELRDGVITFSGTGNMYEYEAEDIPWSAHKAVIQEAVVSDGITSLSANAFYDCTNLLSAALPDSVTYIGSSAFEGCTKLESIDLPPVLGVLEPLTFARCSSLKAINIPDNTTWIFNSVFSDCTSLETVILPNRLNILGYSCFSNCSSLTSIVLPSGITAIQKQLFEGCTNLVSVTIPSNFKTIGDSAFYNCTSLTEVALPDQVHTIGSAAFGNCTSLRNITVPAGVTTIGTSPFAYIRDSITVRCYRDTPIYDYVVENGIAYELLSWGQLEAPVFVQKDIQGGKSVEITAPKGEIFYTLDGTEPTDKSARYAEPLTVTKTTTIRAIAVYAGWDNSMESICTVEVERVSSPYASQSSGSTVLDGTEIELFCDTPGAEIWYTTNGDPPTAANVYTGPFTVDEEMTVYALAVKAGMKNSAMATFTYRITGSADSLLVTTLEATDITETSARVSASVSGQSDVFYLQFVYYEKNNSHVKYTVEADDKGSAVLTGLTPDTEYWFQAKAVDKNGWNLGYICSFMTDVAENVRPTSITLDPTYLTMNVGKSRTLLATVLPLSAEGRTVFWSSEDPSIAKVNADGVVTAVGLGTTRIRATTAANRLVAYCTIDVISSEIRGTFDFSEMNMATNSSHWDPAGFDHSIDVGGNALMASAYLARWDGVVLESADPYTDDPEEIGYHELDPDYHLQNILYLPYRSGPLDNDEIKKAIMEYGAVYTSLKINYSYFSKNRTNYYLPPEGNPKDGGHAVAIIGWDDNYDRRNFRSVPEGNGAFICKNSWGTDSGEDGYFYVSYYDKYIGKANSGDYNAVFYGLQHNDNYNKIYQYDFLGPVNAWSPGGKKVFAANVFPEKGADLTEDELLTAVSFYTYAPGTNYEIYVVPEYTDPDSLKNLGTPVKTGMTEYAGYYTIDLDEAIELAAGTRFAVVVKYTVTSGNATLFIELPATIKVNGRDIDHSSNARANPGESFVSKNAKSWSDLTAVAENANLCIKAFTRTSETDRLMQGIDNENRAYVSDKVYTLAELDSIGITYNEVLEDSPAISFFSEEEEDGGFGSFVPSVLPDLNTNHNYAEGSALPAKYDLRQEGCVSPVKNQGSLGTCWTFAAYASLESSILKQTASSASVSGDGLSQAAPGSQSIRLDQEVMLLGAGSSGQLIATILPFGSDEPVIWKSSNTEIVTVSAHGLVTAVQAGNAIITASTENGEITAQCQVTVTAPAAVRSLQITNTETRLKIGQSILMECIVTPTNSAAQDLVWSVSNDAVASIDEFGVLTGHMNGGVTVYVRDTDDGTVLDSYEIEVQDSRTVYVQPDWSGLTVGKREISGDLYFNVIDTQGVSGVPRNCWLTLAIYSEDGQMQHVQSKTAVLNGREQSMVFEAIDASGFETEGTYYKLFVSASEEGYLPMAEACSEPIRWE